MYKLIGGGHCPSCKVIVGILNSTDRVGGRLFHCFPQGVLKIINLGSFIFQHTDF